MNEEKESKDVIELAVAGIVRKAVTDINSVVCFAGKNGIDAKAVQEMIRKFSENNRIEITIKF